MSTPLFSTMLSTPPGIAASAVDIDVDGILRPVLAVGAANVSSEWEQAPHRHRKAQRRWASRRRAIWRNAGNRDKKGGITPPSSCI